MDIDFQRKVDRYVGITLCWLFSLFFRKKRVSAGEIKPGKILIILLSEMGSLVLAHPMFAMLKKKYPDAVVYVLMFEQNREVLSLLDVVPDDRMLTVSNRSMMRLIRDSVRVLIQLRRARIGTVIDCELFSRISSLFSLMSGARVRAGFHPHTQEGLYRGDFINRPVLYNPYIHMSQQFMTLVEAVESDRAPTVKRVIPEVSLPVPSIKIDRKEMDRFSQKFEADFPHVKGRKRVLLYAGGGLLPIRAWPLSYFCRLAEGLLEQGYVVGIIGMKEDKELAQNIMSHCRHENCIDLTGYTATVRELMTLFHISSLLITNDGGPGHFAAMTPLPSVIFYGPETPVLYGPLGEDSFNYHLGLSCSPCLTAYNHRKSPCDGDNLCLKGILPEEVLAKALDILRHRDGSFCC